MQNSNAHILHNFYSLLLEINFQADEEEPSADDYADPFIQKHLNAIKLKMAKNRAQLIKGKYRLLISEIERLRNVGVGEIRKLLSPSEALQLQPLFNKFESISSKDHESIVEDEELLQLLMILKKKLNNSAEDE